VPSIGRKVGDPTQIPKNPSQEIPKDLYVFQQTKKTLFDSNISGSNWNPCLRREQISKGSLSPLTEEYWVFVFRISIAHDCKLVGLTEALAAEAKSSIFDSGFGAQPEDTKVKNAAAKSSVIGLSTKRHIFQF
jgi:hypothetical protein